MIKTEFGIIDIIDFKKDYKYEPERYNCVFIDDTYINDWWERLITMQTYFHCMDRPSIALDRWGITLIPPESLATFQDIVISDYRINPDDHLVELADFTHISHLKKQ